MPFLVGLRRPAFVARHFARVALRAFNIHASNSVDVNVIKAFIVIPPFRQSATFVNVFSVSFALGPLIVRAGFVFLAALPDEKRGDGQQRPPVFDEFFHCVRLFWFYKVVLVLHEEVEASEGCEGDAGADDDYR